MSTTPFPLPINLDTADRKALRARAHHLDPVVMIGESGLTRAVLDETDRALRAHELIKVRVLGDDRALRQAMSAEICAALGCTAVQSIGKLLVLYRPKPIEDPDARPNAPHIPKKRAAVGLGAPARKRALRSEASETAVQRPTRENGTAAKKRTPRAGESARKAAPRAGAAPSGRTRVSSARTTAARPNAARTAAAKKTTGTAAPRASGARSRTDAASGTKTPRPVGANGKRPAKAGIGTRTAGTRPLSGAPAKRSASAAGARPGTGTARARPATGSARARPAAGGARPTAQRTTRASGVAKTARAGARTRSKKG